MAAVNEDGELDAAGATQVHDGVEGGADGAAGVENIVHEHDALGIQVERDVRGVDRRSEVGEVVVAVEADVEASQRDAHPLDTLDLVHEFLCEQIAAGHDTHKREVLNALVLLDDLVRDAGDGAVDRGVIHDDGLR